MLPSSQVALAQATDNETGHIRALGSAEDGNHVAYSYNSGRYCLDLV